MSIAEQAVSAAMNCEAVKYAYRQSKDGIVVSFVLHPQEVPEGLATAPLGARYVLALVQIGEDELPVRKEVMLAGSEQSAARPRQNSPQVIADGAKQRMDWREVQPAAQAGIRCADPEFWRFLRVSKLYLVSDKDHCAKLVRHLCGVNSRSEFSTNHKKRVLWKQLDDEFTLWQQTDRIGP